MCHSSPIFMDISTATAEATTRTGLPHTHVRARMHVHAHMCTHAHGHHTNSTQLNSTINLATWILGHYCTGNRLMAVQYVKYI